MRRLALVVLVFAATACSDSTAPITQRAATTSGSPAADVSIVRENESIPWVQTFANSCTGEDVEVTGTLHLSTQTVTLQTGEIRDVFHTNFHDVVGVGLTSGRKYRATSAETQAFQGVPFGPPGGPWRFAHEATLHLITPGAVSNLFLHFVFVVTKDPGSPPNVIVGKNDLTCTG